MSKLFLRSVNKKNLFFIFFVILATTIIWPKVSQAPSSSLRSKPSVTPSLRSEPGAIPSPSPSKYLIKTTFVPQAPEKNWDQPWQDACEEAALLTVHYYYQNQNPSTQTIVSDIQKMIDFETKNQFSKDVNLIQMAQIATQHLAYQTKIITNPSLDQIKSYLVSDTPIIIPANGKQLFAENRYFTHGGPYYHNLVILGFDDKKQQFTVHDVGTQHGAYFKYSYQLLMDSIHDFPDSGNKEDINLGAKSVLILLQ